MTCRGKSKAYVSSPSGFSLVEVIIAMMLLGLLSLSFTAAFGFAFANTSRTEVRQQQIAEAESELMTGAKGSLNSGGVKSSVKVSSGTQGEITIEGMYREITVKDSTVKIVVFVPLHRDSEVWP